jgi:hypothetical protein
MGDRQPSESMLMTAAGARRSGMERWKPEVKCSEREERLLKQAGRSRKLFVFLRGC